MPSIPEKTIVFEAEQIENELKRQIENHKRQRRGSKRSSPSHSPMQSPRKSKKSRSPSPKSVKHTLAPVDILIGAQAVDTPFTIQDIKPRNSEVMQELKIIETDKSPRAATAMMTGMTDEKKSSKLAETLPITKPDVPEVNPLTEFGVLNQNYSLGKIRPGTEAVEFKVLPQDKHELQESVRNQS